MSPVVYCERLFLVLISSYKKAVRFQLFALGGLVEYNFGSASFSVWATQEIYSKASNTAALATLGEDFSLITRGSTVFATLSYRLWAPEEPPKPAMFRK